MPEALATSDALSTKEELDARALQAHRIRLQGRIAQFRQKLPHVTTEGERLLIVGELEKYERQLAAAMHPQIEETPTGLVHQIVGKLQEEVSTLKTLVAKLTGQKTDGRIAVGAEPRAPAQAPKA